MNIPIRRRNAYVRAIAAACGLAASTALFAGNPQSSWDNAMQKMDADRDGRITATEHAAGAKQMFDTMDANKDGRVTAVEMDAARAQMKAAHKDDKEMKGEKTGHSQDTPGHSKHKMTSAEKIKVLDTDGDGVLTAREHEAGSRDMFAKMDANQDGALTVAEVRAGHEKMMSKPQRHAEGEESRETSR